MPWTDVNVLNHPNQQDASPAYRIKQGETIVAIFYSNAASVIFGNYRVIYDDKTEDLFSIDTVTSAGLRAAEFAYTHRVARHNGYVVEGFMVATGVVRGQTYIDVVIASDPASFASAHNTISSGYAYVGHWLALGERTEPGPAGGQGNVSTIALTNPLAGFPYPDQTVPTGAIWRIRGWSGSLVTDATAITRLVYNVMLPDGTNVAAGNAAVNYQTASLTETYYASIGMASTSPAVAPANLSVIALSIPDMYLPNAAIFRIVTSNLQAADDWGAGFIVVEEWVMPN